MKKLVAATLVGFAALSLSACASVPDLGTAVAGHGALADPAHARGVNARLDTVAMQDDVLRLAGGATSFRIAGTVQANGASLSMDIHYGRKSSSGRLQISGVTMSFRAVGKSIYIQGDEAFWTKALAGSAPAGVSTNKIMRVVRGKWIRASRKAIGIDGLREFVVRGWTKEVFSAASKPVGRGPNEVVRGVPAVSFLMGDAQRTRIYVPADGKPYPLRAVADGQGSLDFSYWNKPYAVAKPAARNIVTFPGH